MKYNKDKIIKNYSLVNNNLNIKKESEKFNQKSKGIKKNSKIKPVCIFQFFYC